MLRKHIMCRKLNNYICNNKNIEIDNHEIMIFLGGKILLIEKLLGFGDNEFL
jgi:hypothetical protein